ncbi:MAG: hypothetical protein RI956_582 [Pseudomonadota bacterium]
MKHSNQTPVVEHNFLCSTLQKGGIISLPAMNISVNDWRLAANQLNFWLCIISCTGAGSKAALLTKLADTLNFPDHFGMNLDALYDCLTDLLLQQKQAGTVLILEGTHSLNAATVNPILDTLLDAAEFMQPKGHRLSIITC